MRHFETYGPAKSLAIPMTLGFLFGWLFDSGGGGSCLFGLGLGVCLLLCTREYKQRHWIPMELELQTIVRHLMWVLGIELRPSGR